MTMKRSSRAQSGYNLVEVIFALAVFGIVAITIFTLFVMGRRNVYSGKQTSQAIAIGTQVLEDLSSLNKRMIYNGSFGIADTATGSSVTLLAVSGATAPSWTRARVRSTDPTRVLATPPGDVSDQPTTTSPANPNGLLTRWQNMLGVNGNQQTKLTNPSVTLVMIPSQDTASNNPPQFGTSQILQIRVFVRWDEAGRHREVILDTVKAF